MTEKKPRCYLTGDIVESFGTICAILEPFDDGYKAVILDGLTPSGRLIRANDGVTFVKSDSCRLLNDDEIMDLIKKTNIKTGT